MNKERRVPSLRNHISSVQFSRSVVSDSLWHHESQHTRPLCPSPTPGVHSNSCPSSQCCHPAISSSVVPFSSFPNPSQHQGLFQWLNSSHEVAKGLEFQLQHQSFHPSNEHSGLISFRMDWLDFRAVKGTLKSLQLQMSKAPRFRNPFYPLMYPGNLSPLPGASQFPQFIQVVPFYPHPVVSRLSIR